MLYNIVTICSIKNSDIEIHWIVIIRNCRNPFKYSENFYEKK